jgi:hypothetical protein
MMAMGENDHDYDMLDWLIDNGHYTPEKLSK